jgi:ABC-type sugar transport system permease subunit
VRTYGVAAAIVLAVCSAAFLRARNDDARARQLAEARTLAADVGRPHEGLLFAAIASEPKASKYPFLRKRRWLAHPEKERIGRGIDDKATHDLVAEAQRDGEVVRFADDGTLTFAQSQVGRTAIVQLRAAGAKQPFPVGLFAVALVIGASLTVLLKRSYLGTLACAGVLAAFVSPAALPAAIPGLLIHYAGTRGVWRRLSEHGFAYAYVLPAAIGMILLVMVPFGLGCLLGFFDHARGTYTFVGLGNFREILGSAEFYGTLAVTAAWTLINVFLHVTIGLLLALVLSRPWVRMRGLFRVLLILPWAVPNYITALTWKGMFHQQYGAINSLLEMCGLARVSWFSSFAPSFSANVITNTWLGFPFMMVVCLGALQSIPREVYEAAAVDGAGRVARFFRITLPLLRPALFPAIVIGSIWTFNQFNIIYLVSEGKPNGRTDILITEAYRWAFERGERYGMAAAYGMLIFLVLLGLCVLASRKSRATFAVSE